MGGGSVLQLIRKKELLKHRKVWRVGKACDILVLCRSHYSCSGMSNVSKQRSISAIDTIMQYPLPILRRCLARDWQPSDLWLNSESRNPSFGNETRSKQGRHSLCAWAEHLWRNALTDPNKTLPIGYDGNANLLEKTCSFCTLSKAFAQSACILAIKGFQDTEP